MTRVTRLVETTRVRQAWRAASYRRLQRRLIAPKLLSAFGNAYPEAVFVEIGSNDGDQHDHLRPLILRHRWRGVMVEPVPYIFERLRRNYAHLDRVELANVAIADRDGEMPFFHLREATAADLVHLPDWYDGIGSFSREAVLSHSEHIPDVEQRLVQANVPCLTFASLCERFSLDRIDLLLIDTEGYDWELLRQIDLAEVRPKLVVFEHFHLAPADRGAARERFSALGYEVLEEGFDTFCLDPADDDLTRRWRRLRPAVPGVSAHDSR